MPAPLRLPPQVVAAIEDQGGRAYALQADVSKEAEADGLIKAVLARSGSLDVLVNNAGITRDGLLMRMKTADWQTVIDLNLSGVFYCTRAVTRPMLKQKRGRIVNITSVVGLMGNPGQANYGGSQSRRHWPDPYQRQGVGQPRHHGQCRGPRLYRHGHDQGLGKRCPAQSNPHGVLWTTRACGGGGALPCR